MSIDIENLVESHFKKKRDVYGFESIATLIEEVMNASTLEEAKASVMTRAEKFLLYLPKFTPTEAWGDPDSMERKQINRLFAVIGGERTIRGKLEFLQRIANPANKITSPRRIISSLIILESLSAVVTSFGPASAGFVFEGFLSALFMGEQVGDPVRGSLPIQDIMGFTDRDNEEPMPISLKLLGPKTNIEGSYTNLVDGLHKFGRMIYVVARKQKGGRALAAPGSAEAPGGGGAEIIVLEQFTFTQDNFIDALVLDARGSGKKSGEELFILPEVFDSDGEPLDPDVPNSIAYIKNQPTWDDKYALLQQTSGYSTRIKGMHDELAAKEAAELAAKEAAEQEGALAQEDEERIAQAELETAETQDVLHEAVRTEWKLLLEGEGDTASGGKQWGISVPQLGAKSPVRDIVSYEELGQLPYSAEQIKGVAEIHMHKLNDDLLNIFEGTKNLSENINKYFTVDNRSRAINSAEKALENTAQIETELKKQVAVDAPETPADKEL
jgi:hypothetical protein